MTTITIYTHPGIAWFLATVVIFAAIKKLIELIP